MGGASLARGTFSLFLFILPRVFLSEVFLLIVTHPFRYVHRLLIALVWIRIHLLVKMPTVTLTVHNLTVFILGIRVLRYHKSRMPGLQIISEMRIRFLWLLFNRRSLFLFNHSLTPLLIIFLFIHQISHKVAVLHLQLLKRSFGAPVLLQVLNSYRGAESLCIKEITESIGAEAV